MPSSVLCRRAFATVSGHRHSPRHRGGGVASRREGCGNVSCDARRGLSLRAAHRSLRAGRPRRGRDPKSLPKPTAATARLPSRELRELPQTAPNKMKGAWIVISLFATARALPSPVRRLSSVMDDSTIRTAVTAWLADPTAAETTYGHISTWETGGGDGHG